MKIREKFDILNQAKEMLFIPYITAGYPSLDESINILHTLGEYGADIIEIGVPFSDPIADGPTIQYSSQIALQNGVTLKKLMARLQNVKVDKPLILMSYLNPLLAYGKESLYRDMQEIGISGMIVPDMPVEESDEWLYLAKTYDIDVIFLAAPTSSEERIRLIAERSCAFIYCVSVTGTTGIRGELPVGLLKFIRKIKKLTGKPVAVGFGISTPEQISALKGEADGIIVGSRIIEAIRRREDLKAIVRKLKEATRR